MKTPIRPVMAGLAVAVLAAGSVRAVIAEPWDVTPPGIAASQATFVAKDHISPTGTTMNGPRLTSRGVTAVQVSIAARGSAAAPLLPANPPRSFRLEMHMQYQATNYYCVPAAGAMSLSTFGVTASQSMLAAMMDTTKARGTTGNDAARVIDAYIHPRHFDDTIVGDVVGRPGMLLKRVSYDVGTLRRAPILQVWMERLPWNKDKVMGKRIGHAIIAYGYNKPAGTVTVFDPWQPTGGPHTIPARALADTLQEGAGMHYISRL